MVILGFTALSTTFICFIVQKSQSLAAFKAETVLNQKEKLLLLERADELNLVLLKLSQENAVTSVPLQSDNNTIIIALTVLVVCGILFGYYYTSGPIFCPIRTLSQFDNLGNEILIGVRYPAESPVSAAIRLVNTPDVIPIQTFVKTLAENPSIKEVSLNNVSSVVSKTGVPLLENFKNFISTIVSFFI